MSRILGIDYGKKRCGIAVTDILKISINPLTVIPPDEIMVYLENYIGLEEVETLVIGWPKHKDGTETYLVKEIIKFLATFTNLFPHIEVVKVDESFSSSDAKSIIFNSGAKKKKRREKSLVDQVSAIVLIKRYLDSV